MAKTLGYMVTWSIYGTWLQGDKKGYVKDGEIRGENIALKKDCEKKLEHKPEKLKREEKEIVKNAIIEEAKKFNQKILAISVFFKSCSYGLRICGYSNRNCCRTI